jgi:hypothetical protein
MSTKKRKVNTANSSTLSYFDLTSKNGKKMKKKYNQKQTLYRDDINDFDLEPLSVPVSIPINVFMKTCTESSSQTPSKTSQNKILLYEDYKKMYDLRDCSISSKQLDPKKLDKILARKPKARKSKFKDGSITLKQLKKSVEKSRKTEEKSPFIIEKVVPTQPKPI